MDLRGTLNFLYGNRGDQTHSEIKRLISRNRTNRDAAVLTEKDTLLITYGDTLQSEGEAPLETLRHFLDAHAKPAISAVHLLPMYPFSSDDGFSVIDYKKIDPDLGGWESVEKLDESYDLMFDAVVNHISRSSGWFEAYRSGDSEYADFFIEYDENADYSKVVRPRATPLFHTYQTASGPKLLWTTFSEDQLDLNYRNPRVLLKMLEVLVLYAKRGARFLRLDAVGFLWKEPGTPCIHHENAHRLIRVMRHVLDATVPGTILVSETNVPHVENVAYFGKNANEAHMVYQFPLPPLVLHAFFTHDASTLSAWAASLRETPLDDGNTYCNFLASHDGIGMRPTEGLIADTDRDAIIDHVKNQGGAISYKSNPDGSSSVYELNINYFDALKKPDESFEAQIQKFICAHGILFGMRGVPALYIHSLLGSKSDVEAAAETGIPRRINREKLLVNDVEKDLERKNTRRRNIFQRLKHLLEIRRCIDAFNPAAAQRIVSMHKNVFSFLREGKKSRIVVIANVSPRVVTFDCPWQGRDLISGKTHENKLTMEGYALVWLRIGGEGT